MIRHRTITIDCETLPAYTAEQTNEETVAHTNSSNLGPQLKALATYDTATGTLAMARDGQRSSLNGDTGDCSASVSLMKRAGDRV